MDNPDEHHLAWLARSFGRTGYLPLTPVDLAALSDAGTYVEQYPGTHLFKEGTNSDAAYLIRSEDGELFRKRHGGRLVVGRVGPGGVIGDIALLRGQPYISSARADSPVEAFRLDRTKLFPVLFGHPRIDIRWLVTCLNRLEAPRRRALLLKRGGVKGQVAGSVLDEADRCGAAHLSQARLAGLVGASRQSVDQSLSELRESGPVDTDYRAITVANRDRLAAAAGR